MVNVCECAEMIEKTIHIHQYTKHRRLTVNRGRCVIGLLLSLIFIFPSCLISSTTGKIAGKVIDEKTNEPLTGANIVIVGTNFGAAADVNGNFYIINIPPGLYNVRTSMIGYSPVIMEAVRVSVNATSNLDFKLPPQVIEGETVVVTASAISFKKDQTSAVRNVSSDQIEALPIENMQDVIEMQAGVVDGHFRGGRINEVSYLVDGLPIDESFSENRSRMMDIETEAIQEIEIITGTFNAEYGRAMSGIVNAITKDGGDDFHGLVMGNLGNYYTPHHDIFIGLKNSEIARNQDYKVQFEGPILKNKISFFLNGRYQDNQNYINGIRRFEVDDYSYYPPSSPNAWIDIHNGDNAYVPMNWSKNRTLFTKLTYKPLPTFKTFIVFSRNDDEWQNHNYLYKYVPDGWRSDYKTTDMFSFQINHSVGRSMFYELKLSYTDNYNGDYVYKDLLDSRYVNDQYSQSDGPGFFTGGQDKNHTERTLKDLNIKYDITWQLNQRHSLKAGLLIIDHDLKNEWHLIRNSYLNEPGDIVYFNFYDPIQNKIVYPNYRPEIFGDSTVYGEVYDVNPRELSVYLQDKMEFDQMVVNFGVRYDQFDPNTVYPSNLRNPANQLDYPDHPEQMSEYPEADGQYQLSPRFGLSYQLSNTALLHFSYGHFFQMPPMYAMYQNHSFLVEPTDFSTETGNPQVKAQKTVQYEVGLWQQLNTNMGIEVNLFYRDIYDLLSMRIISTYNQIQYGQYTNLDYGNVKGLEIKTDVNAGNLTANLNYSIQFTRGNADNPRMAFTRAGESQDPISRLIPMPWDQRHTLNLSLTYAKNNLSATFTGYYNSGKPYTWTPIIESRLTRVNLYPNNSWRPTNYSLDFFGFYDYPINERFTLRMNLLIENIFDKLNELEVNGQTGRANEAIIRQSDLLNHRSTFNDYNDRLNNPASFSPPRYVKLGIGILF
jgi:outer membrane receptor protein involved in Fe transport